MSGVKRYEFHDISSFIGEWPNCGSFVSADDYDRDTASLHDDYTEACADAMEVARKLRAVEAERDECAGWLRRCVKWLPS